MERKYRKERRSSSYYLIIKLGRSSNAMFISEIPVSYNSTRNQNEKSIHWIDNLTAQTTVRDVILSIIPACDPNEYSFYISTDRKKRILKSKSRIYKIVAKINQQKSSQRLLFEIRRKKHVRFADEILVKEFIPDEKLSLDNRLEIIKENFQKHVSQQQATHSKRSSLKVLNRNVTCSTTAANVIPMKKIVLETLV